MARTFYDVLEVAPSASQDDIRRAYLGLARRLHPDASSAATERAMQEVNEAWHVLRDPRRRADYDRTLGDDSHEDEPRPWDSGWMSFTEPVEDAGPAPVIEVGGRPPSFAVLIPAGAFVAAVVLFSLSMMMTNTVALALSFGLLVLSGLLFLVAPFLVMTRRRRR